jgi:hypothetical protein
MRLFSQRVSESNFRGAKGDRGAKHLHFWSVVDQIFRSLGGRSYGKQPYGLLGRVRDPHRRKANRFGEIGRPLYRREKCRHSLGVQFVERRIHRTSNHDARDSELPANSCDSDSGLAESSLTV